MNDKSYTVFNAMVDIVASPGKALDEIRQAGLYKDERIIHSPQSNRVEVEAGKAVLNLCANNYLGLADHPDLSDFDLYMAGPPPMISAARAAFRAAGMPDEQMHYDSFEYAEDTRDKADD